MCEWIYAITATIGMYKDFNTWARPEEFLRLSNLDMKVDSKGAVLILRGKTGERRVSLVCLTKVLVKSFLLL